MGSWWLQRNRAQFEAEQKAAASGTAAMVPTLGKDSWLIGLGGRVGFNQSLSGWQLRREGQQSQCPGCLIRQSNGHKASLPSSSHPSLLSRHARGHKSQKYTQRGESSIKRQQSETEFVSSRANGNTLFNSVIDSSFPPKASWRRSRSHTVRRAPFIPLLLFPEKCIYMRRNTLWLKSDSMF